MSKNKPHKWAKEIKAWADGATIEYRNTSVSFKWWPVPQGSSPCWDERHQQYRIKAEEKVMYAAQYLSDSTIGICNFWSSLEELKISYPENDEGVKCYIQFTLVDDVITKMEIVK